jgi:crossover junction endodeoxyribonuclease RuvC
LPQEESIIIGIDPGTRITGYGVIACSHLQFRVLDYGCIRPPANAALSERYHIIYSCLCELLDQHRPTAASVETQFLKHNFQSALKLGMARGMAILAATQRQIPLFEYSPSKAKLAVVGNGKASKKQVQAMVQRLLLLSKIPQPEDAADALALAICHAHTAKRNQQLTRI